MNTQSALPSPVTPAAGPLLPPPAPLQPLVRQLTDKFYERRKAAALEVEKTVRELLGRRQPRDDELVREILQYLSVSLVGAAPSSHVRNGGLIALAAVAIALGATVDRHLDDIVPAIVACFLDSDSRVRYYALESLYNVAKVARGAILRYFNIIFDALSKLAADSEISVKNGSELLDRLLKDITAEAVGASVAALRRRMGTGAISVAGRARSGTAALSGSSPTLLSSGSLGSASSPPLQGADPLSVPVGSPSPDASSDLTVPPGAVQGAENTRKRESPSNDTPRSPRAAANPEIETLSDCLFQLPQFILLLAHRVQTLNPFTRLFLIKWISFLNSLPELELLEHLPEFLNALFVYLCDPSVDVRINASTQLAEFLRELRERGASSRDAVLPPAALRRMTKILLNHMGSSDEETQAIALKWLSEFLSIGGRIFLASAPQILNELLPALGQASIQILCYEVNSKLLQLVAAENRQFDAPQPSYDVRATIGVLSNMLMRPVEETQLRALDWLTMLAKRNSPNVLALAPALLDRLMQLLVLAGAQPVLVKDLELLAMFACQPRSGSMPADALPGVARRLVALMRDNPAFADERAIVVVRWLCRLIGGERVFCVFCNVLLDEPDADFGCRLVQKLTTILLCAQETAQLRHALAPGPPSPTVAGKSRRRDVLLATLLRAFARHLPSLLALCLFAQHYRVAYQIVELMGTQLEMDVARLVDLDRLVQLVESPVFTALRLSLLRPTATTDGGQSHQAAHPYFLWKTLYGILMLLPQSSAFTTLRMRLSCASALHTVAPLSSAQTALPPLSSVAPPESAAAVASSSPNSSTGSLQATMSAAPGSAWWKRSLSGPVSSSELAGGDQTFSVHPALPRAAGESQLLAPGPLGISASPSGVGSAVRRVLGSPGLPTASASAVDQSRLEAAWLQGEFMDYVLWVQTSTGSDSVLHAATRDFGQLDPAG